MIKIENISKSFGRLSVLKGIDLHLEAGKIYTVLGPNGSGKTTLIKTLLGLIHPNSGQVSIQEQTILGNDILRERISYVPQIARFPENLRVKELISLIDGLRKQKANPQPFIELFQLHPFMDQKLKNLSGGTRQKVNLVLALMFDTDLLILDEPTSGLDPINRIHLKNRLMRLRDEGKTILMTTHILHLAETLSDEIIFLLEGKVGFQGSPGELMEKTQSQDLEQAIARVLSIGPSSNSESVELKTEGGLVYG
ncbi:ABC transporter ATP-binding protein [bacterium SCSIO 12741]|nr:ABC transporter ATP-binding protein [bacterium SCSIO 12741]